TSLSGTHRRAAAGALRWRTAQPPADGGYAILSAGLGDGAGVDGQLAADREKNENTLNASPPRVPAAPEARWALPSRAKGRCAGPPTDTFARRFGTSLSPETFAALSMPNTTGPALAPCLRSEPACRKRQPYEVSKRTVKGITCHRKSGNRSRYQAWAGD